MLSPRNVLNLLKRPDKWYLGGGGKLLFAPSFPVHPEAPGFWDPAHFYNYEMRPLFTWGLLDAGGSPVTLTPARRSWTPAALTTLFKAGTPYSGLSAVEEKVVLDSGSASSTIRFVNTGQTPLKVHCIGWTAQEIRPHLDGAPPSPPFFEEGRWSFGKTLTARERPAYQVRCRFSLAGRLRSRDAMMSEGMLPPPRWSFTPFAESFHRGRLKGRDAAFTPEEEGILYLALHTALILKPGEKRYVTFTLAVEGQAEGSGGTVQAAQHPAEPAERSSSDWSRYFGDVPSLDCSDERITRYYWYRWYGLRLNTISAVEGNYAHPFVCEGPGYFRAPISYSAFCHVIENRWCHDPALARGSILTFLDNQRDDGGFRGYIDVRGHRQEMFYHANWGDAIRRLDVVHPSDDFLREIYPGFKRYAQYFDRERDDEASGLYDIDNHYETGQEFMHRYTAVQPDADRRNWGEVFRLKGVDVTVYVYELKRTLAEIARRLGLADEAELWHIEAEWTRSAILDRMWDPDEEMFFDVDPATGQRTGVKAATCFYPYLAGITAAEHVRGLRRHLLNPKEFWTPFPFPSSSADDIMFSAEPLWKGKRMNCPWNGRVWPMTNSHLADALGATAISSRDSTLRKISAEFLAKFLRMMFFDDDPSRPNCFEHYNPSTGSPSLYRGIDDYMHSWVNDLIIRYVCGVRPEEHRIVIDPFPFGLQHLHLGNLLIRGRRLEVEGNDRGFTVRCDGNRPVRGRTGHPVILNI